MPKQFKYNPAQDLHAVDTAFAGVDLRKAYVNGAVPANMVGSSLEFNDIEDPSTIMPRPSDVFEAHRQSKHVKSALKDAEAKSEASTQEGS